MIRKWLDNFDQRRPIPPGCLLDILPSPIDRQKLCVHVGIVQEHRFAFYFWANSYKEYIQTNKYNFPTKPILVSLDFHNDVGADADCRPEDLTKLNLDDNIELCLFCWFYLNPLNDGQILPALYLDLFSDVYIINSGEHLGEDREYNDYNSNIHNIYYYTDIKELIEKLSTNDNPVFLDIDLDYFTQYTDERRRIGSHMIDDEDVREVLNLNSPFMSKVFDKLVGLTIALEPVHCGGFDESLKILNILNKEFFKNTLFSDSCSWNI